MSKISMAGVPILLPNHLAFPVVACTLLGCDVIPDGILVDSFIDYVNSYESSVFRKLCYSQRVRQLPSSQC